jgi:hypothetical protein
VNFRSAMYNRNEHGTVKSVNELEANKFSSICSVTRLFVIQNWNQFFTGVYGSRPNFNWLKLLNLCVCIEKYLFASTVKFLKEIPIP